MATDLFTVQSSSMADTATRSALLAKFDDLNNKVDASFAQVVQPVKIVYLQATAADATIPSLVATENMTITSVKAYVGVTAGVGESMKVDIKKNGTSVLTGVMTIAAAQGKAVVSGVIKTDGTEDVVADDKLTVVLDYTAGTATPIVNTLVTIGLQV